MPGPALRRPMAAPGGGARCGAREGRGPAARRGGAGGAARARVMATGVRVVLRGGGHEGREGDGGAGSGAAGKAGWEAREGAPWRAADASPLAWSRPAGMAAWVCG